MILISIWALLCVSVAGEPLNISMYVGEFEEQNSMKAMTGDIQTFSFPFTTLTPFVHSWRLCHFKYCSKLISVKQEGVIYPSNTESALMQAYEPHICHYEPHICGSYI